ncbi:MAG: glyoxalase [Rubrivivax sp.]|nr:MAG: glyoxalase [Rubrivivax sp.]
MEDAFRRATFSPAIYYQDPFAALDWLEKAFGFERTMVITDSEGHLGHSEMRFGDGHVMVSAAWNEHTDSPAKLEGKNTQSVHVMIKEGLDAHCARARAAGAVIVREPEDQFYGDRVYAARDPEGHVWSFGQPVKRVTREEAEQLSGLTIQGWPD